MRKKILLKIIPLVFAIGFYPRLNAANEVLHDSASPMAQQVVHPMTLQPKTSIEAADTKTYVVNAKDASTFSCPSGFALTKIDQSAQKTKNVVVYGECNGAAVMGYAHVWCKNSPDATQSVTEAPQVTYTCQKIVNAWTG